MDLALAGAETHHGRPLNRIVRGHLMARGPTKREIEASIEAFLNPPPMTIDQAMESPNPVNEVLLRLVKPGHEMTPPEHMFHSVMYYLGDTHNGGLEQTMTNDTGELTDVVAEFADKYGSPELRQVMWEIVNLFPNRLVPLDRDERSNVVSLMTDAEREKMAQLTTRLCDLDTNARAGLLELLKEHRAAFTLTRGYGGMSSRGDR